MRVKHAFISVVFLILYAFVHVGFYSTYFKHFPNFAPFKLMHHIHGGIMSGWLFLLIAQPLFLALKKPAWHVFTGRLSYVYAPIVILSLFQVTRFSYNRWVNEVGHAQAISDQALSLGQIATLATFYALAMLFRKTSIVPLNSMTAPKACKNVHQMFLWSFHYHVTPSISLTSIQFK